MRAILLLAAVAGALPLDAQGPPATDIWLAALAVRDGRIEIGTPANVTARPGYDNQPAFLPDGSAFYYTAIIDGQADIFRCDVASGASVRVTATPESEYSPTLLPDGRGFSAVRVERDSTQRLWRFAPDGAAPAVILPAVRPVGYHAWADSAAVVLFVLGEPNALVIAVVPAGRVDTVARGIGRALQPIPGRRAVSFVERVSETESWLAEVDVGTRATRRLARLPPGAEFHAWTRGGLAIASADARLYQWDSAAGGDWLEIADLGGAGLSDITRLAVSPRGDRLAIVALPRP